MAAAAILDFKFMWIWPFRRVDSAVFVFCTKFGSNICYSHWDQTDICFRPSFDDVTRINFRFRLLVAWSYPRRRVASSLHGVGASFDVICADIFIQSGVIRIWIFSRPGLKVLFTPPKFQFWGILPPQFRGTSFRPPKGTSLSGTTRFEPLLVQIWRTVRPVALAKKTKKEKKQWQTGYSPRPPTSPYRIQSLHAGWPPVCSSKFKFLLKSVQWFCR